MTNADLTEIEWLAAALHGTASRLQRAAVLLRAAGDLERLQAKLATIATASPAASPAASAGGRPVAGDRPAEFAGERRADTGLKPVGASRVGAVFDHPKFGRSELGKKSAGGSSRPPF